MSTKRRSEEETLLRENVRKAIRIILDRRAERAQLEEKTLRKIIKSIIQEGSEEVIHPTTWQNDLQDFVDNQMKQILTAYSKLQTNPEQRSTFVLVLQYAINNLFEELDSSGEGVQALDALTEMLNEAIEASLGDSEEGVLPSSQTIEKEQERQELDVERQQALQFARDIGLPVDKLSEKGIAAAVKVFKENIKPEVTRIYTAYGTGDEEDRANFRREFSEDLMIRLDATEGLVGASVQKVVSDLEEGTRNKEQDINLEEYFNLDDLLSHL